MNPNKSNALIASFIENGLKAESAKQLVSSLLLIQKNVPEITGTIISPRRIFFNILTQN